MNLVAMGILGFGLFLLYDINSIKWQVKWLNGLFFLGCLLIGVATTGVLWSVRASLVVPTVERIAWLLSAVFFFTLLIYTLFFALPFKKTYIALDAKRTVYDKGVYALSRHPGVLWFAFFYISLLGLFRHPLVMTIAFLFSLLNLIYVFFQDIWTFPKMFGDYLPYCRGTPFMIPSATSIRNCFMTLNHSRRDR